MEINMAEKKKTEKKLSKRIQEYGSAAIDRLIEMAESEETNEKIRIDIFKWIAEMNFGKPSSVLTPDTAKENNTKITFEGKLDEWSK